MFILSRTNVDGYTPVFAKFDCDEKPSYEELFGVLADYFDDYQCQSAAEDLVDCGVADIVNCRSCTSFELTKV